jgi:hypothetical protein
LTSPPGPIEVFHKQAIGSKLPHTPKDMSNELIDQRIANQKSHKDLTTHPSGDTNGDLAGSQKKKP